MDWYPKIGQVDGKRSYPNQLGSTGLNVKNAVPNFERTPFFKTQTDHAAAPFGDDSSDGNFPQNGTTSSAWFHGCVKTSQQAIVDDKTPILILKNIIQDGLLAVLMISHLMIFDDILKNIRNDSKIIKYHQIAINICTFSWHGGKCIRLCTSANFNTSEKWNEAEHREIYQHTWEFSCRTWGIDQPKM